MKKLYKVTAKVSGHLNNIDPDAITADNTVVFTAYGNKRSTEQSAINYVKTTCRLIGCKLEKVISVKEVVKAAE